MGRKRGKIQTHRLTTRTLPTLSCDSGHNFILCSSVVCLKMKQKGILPTIKLSKFTHNGHQKKSFLNGTKLNHTHHPDSGEPKKKKEKQTQKNPINLLRDKNSFQNPKFVGIS